MFWHSANKEVPVEHWRVVVDVPRHDPDLGIPGQAFVTARLVIGKHVEVPNGATLRLVAVKRSRQVDLARVRVDGEGAVLRELTSQRVPDVRAAVSVRVSSAHLPTMTTYSKFIIVQVLGYFI